MNDKPEISIGRLAWRAEIDIRHVERHADVDFSSHLSDFTNLLVDAICDRLKMSTEQREALKQDIAE